MNCCVYPGSFDPFTVGHLDILQSASMLFDRVHVGVLNNMSKNAVFTPDERVDMIEKVIREFNFTNVIAEKFDGLLVDFLRKVDAKYVIRGLRAITDFEYEFQMNAMNLHLNPSIHTVSFMAKPELSYLSSSTIKEVGQLGGDISDLVPTCNLKFISERLLKK